MKGKRVGEVHDYVCKCDQSLPKGEQAAFQVRFLTALEQAELRDDMYNVRGFGEKRREQLMTGSSTLKALELGLQGWTNFNFEDDGKAIEFNKENFSCIPPNERDEIANYIRGIPEEEA